MLLYILPACIPEPESDEPMELKLDTMYGKALDGFLLMLSREGDIIYVSEAVSRLVGLHQVSRNIETVFFFRSDRSKHVDWFYVKPGQSMFHVIEGQSSHVDWFMSD